MASIVDYLKSLGQDSSYNRRKELALQYGINNYSGTAQQNTDLLNKLKSGADTTSNSEQNTAVTDLAQTTAKQSVLSEKPTYDSQYEGTISNILDTIMNRGSFNINNDANYQNLYNNYSESYMNQGRKAMADAIGNASSLSGGYGNTYAQTVGSQAYDNYMQQLNDQKLNLYNLAYNAYQNDIANDYNQLNAVMNAENQNYSRYRDSVDDWNNEYTRYTDALNNAASLNSAGYTVPQELLNEIGGTMPSYTAPVTTTKGGSTTADYGTTTELTQEDKLKEIQGRNYLTAQSKLQTILSKPKPITNAQHYNRALEIEAVGQTLGLSEEEIADLCEEAGVSWEQYQAYLTEIRDEDKRKANAK